MELASNGSSPPVGITEFGDLERTLRELIAPFSDCVVVDDPGLPDDSIKAHDLDSLGSREFRLRARSDFGFASVPTKTLGSIGKGKFEGLRPGQRSRC